MLTAFVVRQWWHRHASMIRYTYIACLVQFLTLSLPVLTACYDVHVGRFYNLKTSVQ